MPSRSQKLQHCLRNTLSCEVLLPWTLLWNYGQCSYISVSDKVFELLHVTADLFQQDGDRGQANFSSWSPGKQYVFCLCPRLRGEQLGNILTRPLGLNFPNQRPRERGTSFYSWTRKRSGLPPIFVHLAWSDLWACASNFSPAYILPTFPNSKPEVSLKTLRCQELFSAGAMPNHTFWWVCACNPFLNYVHWIWPIQSARSSLPQLHGPSLPRCSWQHRWQIDKKPQQRRGKENIIYKFGVEGVIKFLTWFDSSQKSRLLTSTDIQRKIVFLSLDLGVSFDMICIIAFQMMTVHVQAQRDAPNHFVSSCDIHAYHSTCIRARQNGFKWFQAPAPATVSNFGMAGG